LIKDLIPAAQHPNQHRKCFRNLCFHRKKLKKCKEREFPEPPFGRRRSGKIKHTGMILLNQENIPPEHKEPIPIDIVQRVKSEPLTNLNQILVPVRTWFNLVKNQSCVGLLFIPKVAL